MKDYYDILGVKEDASEEEIRARWTELVMNGHPDPGETGGGDGRIQEINEAYEILKNESTRFEYDLERSLKRAIIRKTGLPKERRMTLRKIILPAGMIILFLIVGLMSFKWLHVASPPIFQVVKEKAAGVEKEKASKVPPVKAEPKVQGDQEVPEENNNKEVIHQPSPSVIEAESEEKEAFTQKILPKSVAPLELEKKVVAKEESKPIKVEKKVLAKEEPRPVKVEEKVLPKEEPKPVKEPGPEVLAKSEAPVRGEKEALKEVPKEVPGEVPKEPNQATLHPGKTLAITLPSSLASEEEVKQFFSSYIDRYNQKDIDGFLSFFSSKAVQNQKDRLNEIRKIYAKFFDQSLGLRYRLEGMKTEIYENAVDVKARFRLDQILKKGEEEKVWTGTISWVLVREDGALKIISLNYQNEKSP